MICEHCGKQLSDTAKFCSGCGNPVVLPILSQAPGADSAATELLGTDSSLTCAITPAAGKEQASALISDAELPSPPESGTELPPQPEPAPELPTHPELSTDSVSEFTVNLTSAEEAWREPKQKPERESEQNSRRRSESGTNQRLELEPLPVQQPQKKEKSKASRKPILAFLLLLISGAVIFLVVKFSGGSDTTWQESYDLGMQYLEEENYEESIIAFTKAIEIEPANPDSYVGRGSAYILSGETDENLAVALSDYETALELDETSPEAYLGIADICIRQGDYDSAMTVLEDALEKTDNDEAIEAKLEELKSGKFRDSSGNIRRSTYFDGSGALQWYVEYAYDMNGRKASAAAYDSAGSQTGYVEYIYDEEGRVLQDSSIDLFTGRLSRWVQEYDSAGNKIQQTEYDANSGERGTSNVMEYNADGDMVRREQYRSDGSQVYLSIYEYSKPGHLTKESLYGFDEQGEQYLAGYWTYETDDEGNITRDEHHDPDGSMVDYTIYVRDENGDRIRTEYYDADGSLEQTVYKE